MPKGRRVPEKGLPPPANVPPGEPPYEIARQFEAVQIAFYGRTAADAYHAMECLECKKTVSPSSFRTTAHFEYYRVTGLCADCQDLLAADKLKEPK